MKYILLLLMSLVLTLVNAQDCHFIIQGKVIDQHDGKPLEGAIVAIYGLQKEVFSDKNGQFILQGLCQGFYEIEISHIDCGTQFIPIKLEKNTSKTFYLEHHVEALNEVALIKKATNLIVQQTIDATVFENKLSQNFAEALTEIQGINTLKTGNAIAKPLLQGVYGSRVITNNQGVRMQDMEWGAEHAPNIATSSVEGVSLAVGAKALKYGGDAVGGVIVLDPRKPVFKNSQKHSAIFTTYTNGLGVLSSQKFEKDFENGLFYGIQASYKKAGNNRNAAGYLQNTGLEQTSISIPFGWHLAHKGIDAYISYFKANNGILRNSHIGNLQDLINQINRETAIPIGAFTYNIENPRQDVSHVLAKISAYYHFEDLGKWTLQYDFQQNNRKEYDVRLGDRNKLPGTDLQLQTHGFQSNFKLDTSYDKLIEFGIETAYQIHFPNPATGVKRLIPDYNNLNFGTYLYGLKTLSPSWELEGSIRTDWVQIKADKFYKTSRWTALGYNTDFSDFIVSDFDTQILTAPELSFNTQSAAFSLHYNNLGHRVSTHLQYIERAPNPAELFSEGLHHSAARIELGSLRMKKEKAQKLAVQYSYSAAQRTFFIAPYFNRINDYMALIPAGLEFTIRGAFPVWEYQQTNANFTGIDFKWTEYFTDELKFTNGASIVKALDLKNNSPFPNIPPVITHHELSQSFKHIKGLSVQLRGDYNFRQNEVPEDLLIFNPYIQREQLLEINRAPNGYFLLSSLVEYQFPKSGITQYKLRLSGENLTNLTYQNYLNRLRYFSNELGINLQLQFQINF
ncbi:TonB-dependent receptor [Flavobacteriaceae bacterium]|nr:TonB-dependent receptor [Flavobacteriaceae bacterium]